MDTLSRGAAKLGIVLTDQQREQFRQYYAELVAWNKRTNLTAITAYDDVQTKHFLDSLTLAMVLPEVLLNGEGRALDVGTGAGLPGIPLKIAFPKLRLTLVESTLKKVRFLLSVLDKAGLADVVVENGRAEDLGQRLQFREKFDAVVSRALAPMPALVELTLPFCKVGGLAVAMKKGDIAEEMAAATHSMAVMGAQLREVRKVELEELGEGRVLIVMDKARQTPTLYPRRNGMPMKRPIRAHEAVVP